MLIEDILFEDFTGTSKKYDPIVGTLVCSSTAVSYLPLTPDQRSSRLMKVGLSKYRGGKYNHYQSEWEDSRVDLHERG